MSTEEWEKTYSLSTSTLRRISLYTGLNFKEVQNLPLSEYLLYNRDSWIDSWNKGDKGRDFLKTLWRLQQTSSDDKAIRGYQQWKEVKK